MRLAAILLGSLLMAAPVAAKAPLHWPSETYGNVHTHEETGDMLGMEARFFEAGGQHMVEFVSCEGWCNDVYVAPLRRTARGFAFHYDVVHEQLVVDITQQISIRTDVTVVPAGRTLRIIQRQGGECSDECKPEELRKLAKPFAIPFAKVNGAR